MPLAAGEKLGPYEILSPLGAGGMGEVYRARDTRLGRSVAIKLVRAEFARRADFRHRFEREARAISALNHPHLCALYDIGEHEGNAYLVMEYVEGETLAAVMKRGLLPLSQSLRYSIEIADALSAAHARGIVHRDLKPGNIMVTSAGVKVLDFGLAKLASERAPANASGNTETAVEPLTKSGAILGTLYYMSLEQVEGKDTDERSDIFSFGVLFYEMITGQRPFTGDSQAAVLASLMKDAPPSINQRQPSIPRPLERLVRKCLEKKAEDRWQSARDLKPALELIDLDAPPPSMTSASVSAPIAVEPPRRKWLPPAVAVTALAL